LRQKALEEVSLQAFSRRWDYVIVDEAQDLPPAALALCVELCRTPAGIFLTADANQSLYNRGFRWQNVHEDLQVRGRTRILRRNYRSTQQIAQAATEIMAACDAEERDSEAALAHLESDYMPRPLETNDLQEWEEWQANQRRLFYVGCTRAMRYLFLTYDRANPSPYLSDLSNQRWERVNLE